ncbi:MAG TPA: amidohydrolase family protein [Microbacteriaceae bacterium]|nr:amidohydrolase family protein [Microbacteriaceae bacterium]
MIDPHTHMGVGDNWGPEKLESDFASESADAAVGGVTTLVTTSVYGPEPRGSMVARNIASGNRASYVDFRITALMVTREHVEEIPALVELGVRSFKYYWGYNGPQAASFGLSESGVPTDLFWLACEQMRDAHPRAFPMIHAEDPDIRHLLIERWRKREPRGSLVAWARANPNVLEPIQLAQAAWIAETVGVPLYMVHVSSHEAVEMLREFKAKGWRTVGETLSAFLYWTADEADARGVGAKGKVQPAIKFAEDRDALWKGIADGTITQVGTDHLMYPADNGEGDFWEKRVGLGPGLATSLPAIITAGLNRGRISLGKMAQVMAENVARQYDMYPTKGVLQPGSDADIVVFDSNTRRATVASALPSASKYSIYEGEELAGWPTHVFIRGELVAREGRLVSQSPAGRYVPKIGS